MSVGAIVTLPCSPTGTSDDRTTMQGNVILIIHARPDFSTVLGSSVGCKLRKTIHRQPTSCGICRAKHVGGTGNRIFTVHAQNNDFKSVRGTDAAHGEL